jgi:hypothetical protein
MLISMGLGLTAGKDGLAAMSYMANFMVHSFFMAFMLFGASMLFRHLKTTQANISYLMLPGSNLEKFLSRYIYVTVVWLLVFFAAYVCADSLRMLFVSVMGGTAEWGLPKFLEVQRMAIVRMSDPAALDFHSLFSNSQSPYVPSPGVSYWTYFVDGFTQHTAIVQHGMSHRAAHYYRGYTLARLALRFAVPSLLLGVRYVRILSGVARPALCELPFRSCARRHGCGSWLFLGLLLCGRLPAVLPPSGHH